MKCPFVLIFKKDGFDRATKTQPKLSAGEFAVNVTVDVPDTIFTKPPAPTIEVVLHDPQLTAAAVSIDSQAVEPFADTASMQRAIAGRQLALLIEKGQTSKDPDIRAAAEAALVELYRANVDVKVIQPEPEGAGA